jgi:nucleotide-binding universal stress UspA family protein
VKNILVAVDDFENITIASPLIQTTIELANAFSSKVWLLHVVPQSRRPPFNIDSNLLRREAAHELHYEHEFIQQLAKCLRDRDIEATSLMVEGVTIKTILDESDRLGIDLIILGCYRHSELFGSLTSDTEKGLLNKCSLPVLFIPVPE